MASGRLRWGIFATGEVANGLVHRYESQLACPAAIVYWRTHESNRGYILFAIDFNQNITPYVGDVFSRSQSPQSCTRIRDGSVSGSTSRTGGDLKRFSSGVRSLRSVAKDSPSLIQVIMAPKKNCSRLYPALPK